MKKLIPILFLTLTIKAQKDTIFKKAGDKIICSITMVNDQNIFYDRKGVNTFVPLKEVQVFSQNGKRSNASVILGADDQDGNTPVTKKQMEYLTRCLSISHKQYVAGGVICFTGSLIGLTGITLSLNNIGTQNDNKTNTSMTVAGGAIALIGAGIMIHSHKWIGKASLALSADGFSASFKF